MENKRLKCFLLLCAGIILSVTNMRGQLTELPLLPRPSSVKAGEGVFRFNANTELLFTDPSLGSEAELFASEVERMYGYRPALRAASAARPNSILLSLDGAASLGPEGYRLDVTTTEVRVRARTAAGIFYGLQTLFQLLPAGKVAVADIPAAEIEDVPRFGWRGMHLDVCRHFFSKQEVFRYLDHMARYKLNRFHWHLTDDQGWRIEIKKFPKLQQVSAWRNGTLIGHYGDVPERYDTMRYGGYYTQEEIREVVAYAARRHIEVVPEIEMPGHALAALAAYPELSCTGGPFETARTWGVFQDVFCTREETFAFLQDVLTEVCDLFPATYIHVGGDECPKDRWKSCPRCQARMKELGLSDEHALQSWFVQRLEKFLATKGKRIIGWDEILEGGLAPGATVMSWRGYAGGMEAARQEHEVIMAPTAYCYFDYYQSNDPGEPLSIGGYLPIETVYRFEPIPEALTAQEGKYIIGTQANLWTEYIPGFRQLEYMAMPRMIALAEVAWSPAAGKDFSNFTRRLVAHMKLLDLLKVNYSKALFDVTQQPQPAADKGISIALNSNYPYGQIRYTFDGKDPDLRSPVYERPIPLGQSSGIKAALFDGGRRAGGISSRLYRINRATGCKVVLAAQPSEEYSSGGAFRLVDGVTGPIPWFGSDWLGFSGNDLDATLDLGLAQDVRRVAIDFLEDRGSWIWYPVAVEISISEDGKAFTTVKSWKQEESSVKGRWLTFDLSPTRARYVRILARNAGNIPDGFPGAGHPAWLFSDEIVVE
jgi:hexosaminidase